MSVLRSSVSHSSNGTDSPSSLKDIDFPDGGFRGYLVVLGLFFGLTVNLGLINSIGVVQGYVSNHQLESLKASPISWIFSIYLALAYSVGIFVGPIFDKHGALGLLIGSTTLLFLGLMATANSTHIWQFILSFIALGIGNGLGMTPLIAVINHWFLKKRGNCTGFATCGGSVGGLAFPLLLRYLYEAYGFVWAIRILAFTCLGCMIIAILLVKERFTRNDIVAKSETDVDLENKSKKLRNKFSRLSFADLKQKNYVALICGGFCAEISLVLIMTYLSTYAIAQGVSESTSYLLLTVWNATGIIGRLIPGYLSDHWGKFNINITMLISFNICLFVMWLPFGHSLSVLYAFSALGGCFLGSILSMLPTCLSQISPVERFGLRYGLLNFFLSFGNLFVVPIGAAVVSTGTVHDYNMFVVMVSVLSVVGTSFWTLSRQFCVGQRLRVKV
ncbi:uncharacterized protein PRCAT00005698001 [Priceomyces carsonii]|uniref:uncharacterized protein n=1 Tax=Priceomyces carsonii TaxID=28549 RepID=UPI002EDAEEF9|nr:unnamed protein product [Priceomyces carsonii]